jgi:hypothetical protein
MPKEDSNILFSTSLVKNPPPPAYTAYFDDATIYAQIDHSNNTISAAAASVSSGAGGGILYNNNNNSLQNVDRKFISENQILSPLPPHQTLSSSSTSNCQNMVPSNNNNSSCLNSSADIMGLSSSSQTAALFPTMATANQFPSNNFQTLSLPNSNKQFLHDIVVTRSPLSFSEQESCV